MQEALYKYGHDGYTGSIAEKTNYQLISCERGIKAIERTIEECMRDENHFCQDKWGPAAAIQVDDTSWVFFGYASS